MKKWHAIFLIVTGLAIHTQSASAEGIQILIDNTRRAFYRGESIDLPVTIVDTKESNPESGPAILVIQMGDVLTQRIELEQFGSHQVQVETNQLRSGTYKLSLELIRQSESLAIWEELVTLAPKPNPKRMGVWLWPHTSQVELMTPFTDYSGDVLRWWANHGFTNIAIGEEGNSSLTPDMQSGLDSILALGLTACILPNGGIRDEPPGTISDPDMWLQDATGKFVKSGVWGNDTPRMLNPFHPEIATWHRHLLELELSPLSSYPQIATAFFNTEIVDDLPLSANSDAKRLLRETLGYDSIDKGEPRFVAPGVLCDNDRAYRLKRHRFQMGNGLSVANRRVADVVHQYLPDVITINDPYRYFSMLECYPGIDAVSTWTYTNPDPKTMLFIETLRAACRHTEQIPLHVVSLWNYPGKLTSSEHATMMGPDRFLETTWINLSRAPKIIGYYFGSKFDPLSPKNGDLTDPGGKVSEEILPQATFDAARRIAKEVIQPYGQLLTQARVAPRHIAVLSSDASRIHGKSKPLPGYYPNLQVYHFYSLLAMAHLPADVIFEDTFAHMDLDDYDMLVLPKCDVLPESVYKKILAFQQRGGIVVADQYLGPALPGVIRFNFDFMYRNRVSATAIAEGKVVVNWDDRLKIDSTKFEAAEGVTALDDQRIMASYAETLRKVLDDKVTRSFDCDTETALINELEGAGGHYLVVVNDKREYSSRLKKFQSLLDQLVPQTVAITAHDWQESDLRPYDLLRKEALPVEKLVDGSYRFHVELSAIGGTIIALQPKPICDMTVTAPKRIVQGQTGKIEIRILNSDDEPASGLQPIRLTLTDSQGNISEISDYYCLDHGKATIELTVALNDHVGKWNLKVEDLTSGLQRENMILVATRNLGE